MIDAYCYTLSYVVNSGNTEPNLTRFLLNVDKLLPINLLKSKLRHCNPFWTVSVPNKCGLANCGRVAAKNVVGQ